MSTLEHAPDVRASDAEREEVVARLQAAHGDGRLDLAETERRVAAAYAAEYRAELTALLADLPESSDRSGAAPSWSELWTSLVWRTRTTLWGVTDAPTARQSRRAGWLVALAVIWFLAVALVAAAVV